MDRVRLESSLYLINWYIFWWFIQSCFILYILWRNNTLWKICLNTFPSIICQSRAKITIYILFGCFLSLNDSLSCIEIASCNVSTLALLLWFSISIFFFSFSLRTMFILHELADIINSSHLLWWFYIFQYGFLEFLWLCWLLRFSISCLSCICS